MLKWIRWFLFLIVLLSPTTRAADPTGTLADLPVVDTRRVAPAKYAGATQLAVRGRAPVDIALAIVGRFEGLTQHLILVNKSADAPSAARVTVLRDGLLDDSIRGERWDIDFDKTAAGVWKIREVKRAWRCWRGAQTDRFAAAACS